MPQAHPQLNTPKASQQFNARQRTQQFNTPKASQQFNMSNAHPFVSRKMQPADEGHLPVQRASAHSTDCLVYIRSTHRRIRTPHSTNRIESASVELVLLVQRTNLNNAFKNSSPALGDLSTSR